MIDIGTDGLQSLRKHITVRHKALKEELEKWLPIWKSISRNLFPKNYMFSYESGYNMFNDHILDNSPLYAIRTLCAGLMGGATSPARAWFKLGHPDSELTESREVKQWLNLMERRILSVFAKSNTYSALHLIYEHLGAFGTACAIKLDDAQNGIHLHVLSPGTYCIGVNYKGDVNVVYREFRKTIRQVISYFGLENCSDMIKDNYRRDKLEGEIDIIHAIEPIDEGQPLEADSIILKGDDKYQQERIDGVVKSMDYRSIYLEKNNSNGILKLGGFYGFPCIAPRWIVTESDSYGISPALECLGDIKQLQYEQSRKMEAIDNQTKPGLIASKSLANEGFNPYGVTFSDTNIGVQKVFESKLNLSDLERDIYMIQTRIDKAFFKDLFLMISNAPTRAGVTATEIFEKKEEKLLMIGPVLERLHHELLGPLVKMTLDSIIEEIRTKESLGESIANDSVIPEVLDGKAVKVEYISILSQAQRQISTTSMDQILNIASITSQMNPDILDNIDFDKFISLYGDYIGVNPEVLQSKKIVEGIRTQRAKQQQAEAQQAQASASIQDAKALSETSTNGDNALTSVMDQMGGY